MSDHSESPARPVSLFTIVFLFALFAAFYGIVKYTYAPVTVSPQNDAAEKLPKDLEWRSTAKARRAALSEMRDQQGKQASSYGWVDQKNGVVRLPIDRAIQLTAEQYRARK